MDTTTVHRNPSGSASDVAREVKRKAGIPVDDEQTTASKKAAKKKKDEETGGMFGKMGIDLGNLGGLAESVLKTIGLAGKSVK